MCPFLLINSGRKKPIHKIPSRPKTLAGLGSQGSTEVSSAAAERLADWRHSLSDQVTAIKDRLIEKRILIMITKLNELPGAEHTVFWNKNTYLTLL
jgi:hypothetical protein